MGLSKPNNSEEYGAPVTGKENFSANKTDKKYASIDTAMARDNVFAKIEQHPNRQHLHKSFDFSNVALFATNGDGSAGNDLVKTGFNPMDNSSFRRFHQMTLYIQVPITNSHANAVRTGYETIIITSNLPESVQYDVGSEWGAPLNFGDATTNLLMQMVGSKIGLNSGVSRVTTMRIWTGSKPLSLNLKIPVIDDGGSDTRTNLVEALEVLGSLALPRAGGAGFYTPPPSPLRASLSYATGISQDGKPEGKGSINFAAGGSYGRIMLQLGGILLVDNCIIEGFSVSYPNTKAMIRHDYSGLEDFGTTGQYYLHPLLAEVTLKVSTIEAMTADYYSRMLWARDQKNAGAASVDLSTGLMGYITGGVMQGFSNVKSFFTGGSSNGG